MELAKRQRSGYRGQVTRIAKDVQSMWDNRDTIVPDPLDLQLFLDKLQHLDSPLTRLDSEIGAQISDPTQLDDEATKTVNYKEEIWDAQSKVTVLIKKSQPEATTSPQLDASLSPTVRANATRLPKLSIPKFDGDPLKWREFWDCFRHSIHDNVDLTDIEKFQHLKALLTDEARIVADGYRLTDANYGTVVEVLIDRFGSEELAVFAHFDKFLALPVSTTDTHKLQHTYDETEKHIRSLVSLGLGEETFGQVFTPIILSKLPRPIRTDLHRRNGTNRWTLSAVRELFRSASSSKANFKSAPPSNKSFSHQSRAANLIASAPDPSAPSAEQNYPQKSPTYISSLSNSTSKKGFVQMQMATIRLGASSDGLSVRLFFDTGSSRSYITSSLVHSLNLKPMGTGVISNGRFEDTTRRTHSYPIVNICLPSSEGSIPMDVLVTDTIASDPPAHQPENVNIDLLVGSDHYYHIVKPERIDLDGGLILLGSKLGYIATGTVYDDDVDQTAEPSCLSALHISTKSSVSFQTFDLEKFWQLEDIGVKDDSYKKDDELAIQRFNDSIRCSGDRYEVGWPWKTEYPELPNNYNLAFGRLKSLFKRLQKDPDVLAVYDSTIRDQLSLEIIEEVENPTSSDTKVYYLPHHCVIKPDRSTTKLRFVYDGSAKGHRSLNSLNDCLLRGPVFLQNLCGLLLRFRIHNIAVTADIEKAFLQVSLRKDDRDMTRFLWLKDTGRPVSEDNITVYRFCRVLFGLISSPFLLDATIKHFLRQQSNPVASLLVNNMYVDNIVCGVSSDVESKALYGTSNQLFAKMGMNIRDWFGNSTGLKNSIPEEDRGKSLETKVLGMKWKLSTDTLSCPSVHFDAATSVTKRHLLQAISKVFDPCGLFSPVVVRGKLLVRQLWIRNIQWDQILPDDIFEQWQIVSQCIKSVSSASIPRYVGHSSTKEWSIHCFCDASAKAYASVVNFQTSILESKPVLVFSKTKLAPIKPVSIPRLELMAVVVGCRISKFVRDHMGLNVVSVTIWSDSKCVLQWLDSTKVLSVFVENRIREIRGYDYKFLHVGTSLNPADLCSRGTTFLDLRDNPLWWYGPSFLQDPDPSHSPVTISTRQNTCDTNITPTAALQNVGTAEPKLKSDCLVKLENFSTLQSLLRITAWSLRFATLLLTRLRPIYLQFFIAVNMAYFFRASTHKILLDSTSAR